MRRRAAKPAEPAVREQTTRQALRQVLRDVTCSARDLSQRVSVSEKDVAVHLEHLQRSLGREGERLVIHPAVCKGCGFEFTKRDRLAAPTRCPRCRGGRIDPPRFTIERRRR